MIDNETITIHQTKRTKANQPNQPTYEDEPKKNSHSQKQNSKYNKKKYFFCWNPEWYGCVRSFL